MRLMIATFVALWASHASADVTTDLGARPLRFLYLLDGENVAQGQCAAVGSRTRTTCRLTSRQVAAGPFAVEAWQLLRLDADAQAAAARDIQVRHASVELRLQELLNSTPDPAEAPGLRQLIAAEDARLVELEEERAGLDDQITRIRARIATGEASLDLPTQLVRLEGQVAATRSEIEKHLKTRRDLQDRLVAAKGNGRTDQDFRDLIVWRDALTAEWDAAQRAYQLALDERVGLARILTFLFDGQSAYPVEIDRASAAFSALKPFAAELDGVFERIALASGTSPRSAWFAAARRGVFVSPDPVSPARIEIRQWHFGERLELDVSGFAELKANCLNRGDSEGSLAQRSTDVLSLICRTGDQPFGTARSCTTTQFYDDVQNDRRYRLDVTVAFLSPEKVAYESTGNCYELEGDAWVFSRSEREAELTFR